MRERPVIPRHLRIFAPGPVEWNNARPKNRFVNPLARSITRPPRWTRVSRLDEGDEEEILFSQSLKIWRERKEGEVIDESNDRA